MSKLVSILKGWGNLLVKNSEIEKLAFKRAKVCALCPEAIESKLMEVIGDEIKEFQGLICNKCKCPLSTKARSKEESCPLGKW